MMAALPYIQLYVADYLSDTMHLTTEEHGAYLLLIMNYWQTGKPINQKYIPAIIKVYNERLTDVIETLQHFFNVDEHGFWFHKRIEADLEKVRSKSIKASNAGKISAEKRWQSGKNITNVTTDVIETLQHNCNHTDTDTDTETKKDIVEQEQPARPPRQSIPFSQIVEKLNEVVGSDFKHQTKATRQHISARFAEGFTLSDFFDVIEYKSEEWKNEPEMVQYLRPQTLFGTKFESYLQASKTVEKIAIQQQIIVPDLDELIRQKAEARKCLETHH